jgi:hypothetical protein
MGEQMFTMKSEVVARTSVVNYDLFQSESLTISELPFEFTQKFHALLFTRLSKLD